MNDGWANAQKQLCARFGVSFEEAPRTFLGLPPPGWHFLIAGPQEDVWEDPSLLVS
jgi:hypothetical protein